MITEDVVVGIDMGATHTRICVMDFNQQVLVIKQEKTQQIIGNDFTQGILELCKKCIAEKSLRHLVIGMPATISADRQQILSAPNLGLSPIELEHIPAKLKQSINCQFSFERDVNLQMLFDVNHFQLQQQLVIGVYLGTGIGLSIWNQGELFIGTNGVAGELGHIPYAESEKLCSCGNQGCLEVDYSGKALKNWYEHSLFDFPIDQLFEKQLNHPFIQNYLQQISKAISAVVNLFDPNCLIIGGGIVDMPNFPFTQLEHCIGKFVRKPLPSLQLSILKAPSSSFNGAIGAALYALQKEKV